MAPRISAAGGVGPLATGVYSIKQDSNGNLGIFNGATEIALIDSNGNMEPNTSTPLTGATYGMGKGINPLVFNVPTGKFFSFRVNGTGQIEFGSLLLTYNGISVAGNGIPSIYGTPGLGVNLNTTATQICTYTPAATGFYSVRIAISCKTTSTVALTISYSDPQAGTITAQQIYSKALTGGTTDSVTFNVLAAGGTAITVNGTDSLALGDAYASGQVEELQ